MARSIAVIIFLTLSFVASASKCGAPIKVENRTSQFQKIRICLEHEVEFLKKCNFPREYVIQPNEVKSIKLAYSCGHSTNSSIKSYWVLYDVSNGYKKLKYGLGSIVIDD